MISMYFDVFPSISRYFDEFSKYFDVFWCSKIPWKAQFSPQQRLWLAGFGPEVEKTLEDHGESPAEIMGNQSGYLELL